MTDQDRALRSAVLARRIRYDSCDRCDLARGDRHHDPAYRMHRTPYDFPSHPFVDPRDAADLR